MQWWDLRKHSHTMPVTAANGGEHCDSLLAGDHVRASQSFVLHLLHVVAFTRISSCGNEHVCECADVPDASGSQDGWIDPFSLRALLDRPASRRHKGDRRTDEFTVKSMGTYWEILKFIVDDLAPSLPIQSHVFGREQVGGFLLISSGTSF